MDMTQKDYDEFTKSLINGVKYQQYYLTNRSKIRSKFDLYLKKLDKIFYTIAIFLLLATIVFVNVLSKDTFGGTIRFGLFFCGSMAITLNAVYLIATHGTTNQQKAQKLANKATRKIYNAPIEVIDKVTFAAMVGKFDEAKLMIERSTHLLEVSKALNKLDQASIDTNQFDKVKSLKKENEVLCQQLNTWLTSLIKPDLQREEQQIIQHEGDMYLLPDDVQNQVVNRFIDNL